MPNEDLSYFQEEEFKKKFALYEEGLRNGQPAYLEADELTDIAEYYLVHDETDKAMQCIDYALRLHPGSVDPLVFLARQKMFNGDLKGARTIRDCITDQNDREVVFLNAELLLREQKVDEAAGYLARQAEQEESDLALFYYDTACLFLDYGLLDHAAQWGGRALSMEPENESFLKFKADFLMASNRPKEAIAVLDHLLDQDPYNLSAWHTLGEAHFMNEDYAKTLEAADFALAIDEQDIHALLLKANCRFQQQYFEEAHQLYARYLEMNKSNEVPYLFDGICLAAAGDYRGALAQLQRAEELSKGDSAEQQQIYANLSDVYSKLHQPEAAFAYIDKIKGFTPDYDTDLYKGHVLMENGKTAEGMSYYEAYLQKNANDIESHFFVGVSLAENKAYDEAFRHFQYVREHDTSDKGKGQKVYAYLAYCTLMQGRYQEFLSYLKTACEKDPDSLDYTIGRYIPEEIPAKDFYDYVIAHSDVFLRLVNESQAGEESQAEKG